MEESQVCLFGGAPIFTISFGCQASGSRLFRLAMQIVSFPLQTHVGCNPRLSIFGWIVHLSGMQVAPLEPSPHGSADGHWKPTL